jgi:hypothetical protein
MRPSTTPDYEARLQHEYPGFRERRATDVDQLRISCLGLLMCDDSINADAIELTLRTGQIGQQGGLHLTDLVT